MRSRLAEAKKVAFMPLFIVLAKSSFILSLYESVASNSYAIFESLFIF